MRKKKCTLPLMMMTGNKKTFKTGGEVFVQKKHWTFRITGFRLLLILFVLTAVVVSLYRFIFGLGSVTNLNDQWPWGLWIGFDLLCGIALAGGGFSTALIVHVLHKEKYLPIARAALLTSLIGYIIALVSLFLDLYHCAGQSFSGHREMVQFLAPLLFLGIPLGAVRGVLVHLPLHYCTDHGVRGYLL